MCNNRPVKMKAMNPLVGQSVESGAYNAEQVSNIIKHYQELRSAVELVAARCEHVGGGSPGNSKEEILCTLVDIDQAMAGKGRS